MDRHDVPLLSYWRYRDDKRRVETPCEAAGVVGTNTGLPQQRPVSAGQVSRNVAERSATLHIGNASLDIYPGCDAEQLKMLVELLRLC